MPLLIIALFTLLSGAGAPTYAQDLALEAPERLQQYLRIDTINPPGNESRGVDFLAKILAGAGINYETAESAPGRGNIWARLEGGDKPALILLHHIDVVTADAEYWDVPPLSGELKDGYIWGRGAIDTKGLGIAQLQAFLALHAASQDDGLRLNRDVIYMATADEEAGGFFGAGWLVENRPELFEKVGFLINEGGSGRIMSGQPVFRIEVTQKVPLWLKLTATDIPGHGSSPRTTSAVTRILRAGNRIAETEFPRRVVPPVREMFAKSAEFFGEDFRSKLADIDKSIKDARFMAQLHLERPGSAALLGNTCSITRLEGSSKINVVPPKASMELDCRLLPDQDPDEFLRELKIIVNDPEIEIEKLMGFSPAISSTATPLFRSITHTLTLYDENVRIIPAVSTGFTDSHFFRDIGIVSYGFAPFLYPENENTGVHGNNERIAVENLVGGTRVLTDFLIHFTTQPPGGTQ
jgi:acetylornithine deacetylase/succinyl-diaminopimelate desuccinylase-like protein